MQQAENEAGVKMAHLYVDGGGEFISLAMTSYIADYEATLEFSALYTSEHNSVAEQCWQIIHTMKDFMLLNTKLPNRFWAEAMNTMNYLRNQLPTYTRTVTLKEA